MTVKIDSAGDHEMRPPSPMGDRAFSFEGLVADQAAFRTWYDDALPRVYRYLLTRCGDQSLAEEATQEAFVEAFRARRRFQGRSDPVTWVCAIGRNRLADHVRRDHRNASRQLRLIDARADFETTAWRQSDVREGVERALTTLSREQRLVLAFRYLDQLPVREIAALLRRSESATESLLSRARDGFRGAYEGQTDE
ncbi:MAG: RNA polymerase sigma factor [Chloroflexota bacterium]